MALLKAFYCIKIKNANKYNRKKSLKLRQETRKSILHITVRYLTQNNNLVDYLINYITKLN